MEGLDLLKEKGCAFTGHRVLGADFSAEKLNEAILAALEGGVRVFYNGLAVGFDLLAAELVIAQKYNYPDIYFIACIPCKEQEKYYSQENKIRYYNVKGVADEVIVLSERYYGGCMQVRDRYMAERATSLIAYCQKKEGGTAYTVRCFEKMHPNGKITFI